MSVTTTLEKIVTIVGIRFRPAGRIYYFDPQGASYTTGQYVIVETVRGVEAGRVVIASKKLAERELSDSLKPVLRLANEDELRMMLSFKGKEKDTLVQCAQHIQQHNLPMKLVEAEYTFDGSRLTFYFTADERVDFRALPILVSSRLRWQRSRIYLSILQRSRVCAVACFVVSHMKTITISRPNKACHKWARCWIHLVVRAKLSQSTFQKNRLR